jgi:hypothetical protein
MHRSRGFRGAKILLFTEWSFTVRPFTVCGWVR